MVKIIVRGFPTMESGIEALNGGADAYLVKPVASEELLKIIEEKLK
jgi:DNA-binding response OmpR family regulator